MPDAETAPPPPKRRLLPAWAPRAAFEALLIVFSVVLALSLNDWAADRREAERAGQLREALIAEIAANRTLLTDDHYLPHHLRLRDSLGAAGGQPGSTGNREAVIEAVRMFFSTGLHPARLRDAVWRSAGSSDLTTHMPIEEVFLLAAIYRAQEDLESLNRTGYETTLDLVDLIEDETPHASRMMRMGLYLEDMTGQEQALVALYDQALARMDGASDAERDSEAR